MSVGRVSCVTAVAAGANGHAAGISRLRRPSPWRHWQPAHTSAIPPIAAAGTPPGYYPPRLLVHWLLEHSPKEQRARKNEAAPPAAAGLWR
eukprot:COSAG01_NODE_1179_length_11363_cov_18.944701_14_plen_91_part_00